MRIKMILVAVSVLFLLTGTSLAADVTGTWVAEMEMPKMGPGGPGGGGGPGAVWPLCSASLDIVTFRPDRTRAAPDQSLR